MGGGGGLKGGGGGLYRANLLYGKGAVWGV